MEPSLNSDDIQAHIYPGFASQFSVVIGLRLDDPIAGRHAMLAILPSITPMDLGHAAKEDRRAALAEVQPLPDQPATFVSLSFSASALRVWNIDLSNFDSSFTNGMQNDARELRDPVDATGIPSDWQVGLDGPTRLDALLVAGHSDKEALFTDVETWIKTLSPAWSVVLKEYGGRRDGDKELFGFHDGVSQPALRGKLHDGNDVSRRVIAPEDPRSTLFAKPGQRLIWPGQFIFGYPVETSAPLTMGEVQAAPLPWMHNGSYLVFRRLVQKTELFEAAVASLENDLKQQGEVVPPGWTAARMVGRWPDGTPLSAAPAAADPELSAEELRLNNFQYARGFLPTPVNRQGQPQVLPAVAGDLLGRNCPFAAHIRKVNPRDGSSEIGPERHPSKQILRRGIAFGPEFSGNPAADGGLLFLSFQTSINDQFKFLQINWANSPQRPTSNGLDPIIGQDGTLETNRQLIFDAPSGRQVSCSFNGRWVIPTGGGYFVTPGISGLRTLLDV